MFLPKPPEQKSFETPPAGAFPARCYRFIDLGTQAKEWGNETKFQHQIMLSWELPTELMTDGKPFSIHQRYTWSMHEKSTLRKMLESWRGVKFTDTDFGEGGFTTKVLVNSACTLSIVHATKGDATYANISAVSRVMKGIEIPPMINEPIYFTLEEFDQKIYDKLSQSLKETIARSPEYHKILEARNPLASQELPTMHDTPY